MIFVTSVLLVAGCSRTEKTADAPASSRNPNAAAPSVDVANDGHDPKAPTLSAADQSLTDARHGWGWSDACWKEFRLGQLGYAKAACDKGLTLSDLEAQARAAILYNEGLIAEQAGDKEQAQAWFERSLGVRVPNDSGRAEVSAALLRVGGAPPTQAAGPGVVCAEGVICPHVCCPRGDRGMKGFGCANAIGDCASAENGESEYYECDGPEDCADGKVCCMVPGDRDLEWAHCIERTECTGTFTNPRYGVEKLLIACHEDSDCSTGTCGVRKGDIPLRLCE